METGKIITASCVALFAMIGVYAENENVPLLKPQVVPHDAVQKGLEAVVITLDAEEQAFVAKLSDQNRKIFSNRLNTDQRRSVLVAVENGTDPNEAVHRMIGAMEIRERGMITQAESEHSKPVSR